MYNERYVSSKHFIKWQRFKSLQETGGKAVQIYEHEKAWLKFVYDNSNGKNCNLCDFTTPVENLNRVFNAMWDDQKSNFSFE